jgi:hypothetical protein
VALLGFKRRERRLADEDGDTINAARIAQLCAADWGLWRTCTMNLDRVSEGVGL